ncbi:polysaccharide biosynthesis C-terminal domain-containing protein [Umboniibacter marinipuniceus]|uniref:polysaccharide biosynthesis C-terminal domain-containing protein n=1 Tax=Umboniibacter marinipuniceus TaxID=569599 RepID=UPI001472CF55|nr:polysaccharide biosynthesis C-terminal domain-containing protein [Umboniibacter marinipuniceus]
MNELLARGLSLGLILILPLLLTPTEFGYVVFYVAVEQVLVSLLLFGQSNYFIKVYQSSESLGAKLTQYGIAISVIFFIAIIVTSVGLVTFISGIASLSKGVPFLLILCSSVMLAVYELKNIKFRADGQHRDYFRSKLLFQSLKFAICMFLVVVLGAQSLSYPAALFIAVVVTSLRNHIADPLSLGFVEALPKLNSVLVLVPFAMQSLINIMYSFVDRIMVKDMLSVVDLAVYGFSYNVASLAFFSLSVIFIYYTPVFYRVKTLCVAQRILFKVCSIAACCLVILIFFLSVIYDPIIEHFPIEYRNSDVVARILIISFLFHVLYLYGFHLSNYQGFVKLMPIYVTISLLLNVLFNYVFIARYGVSGAALSTLLSEMVLAFLMVYNARIAKRNHA